MAKYQQYAEYKDSGVEWLGKIPSHWTMSKLRYLFDFSKGLSITKENLQDEGIPCVNYGEVHSKYGFEVDPKKHLLKCVSENYLKTSENALLNNGDFVFADTSEDLKGSGNFTHLVGDEQIFAGYHTVIARPHNANASRFYAYLFESKEFRSQIHLAVKGVKVFSITQAMLRSANAWLPSTDEQVKIANFLDYETSKIDSLIEKQQQLIELLKEKRQAVISNLIRVQNNEPTIKLKYAVEILAGYSFSSSGFQTEDENGIALLRGINVGVGSIKWDECVWWSKADTNDLKRYLLKEGDLVFGMDRPWISSGARVAEVKQVDLPSFLVQRVARIRCIEEFYQPYIKLVLGSKEFKSFIESDLTGVSVPHISTDQIISFEIRDLPYDQQVVETDKVINFIVQVKDLINKAQSAIQLMQERRTALISAAVTGKIDVRNWQNPNNNNEAKTEFSS